MKKQERRQKYDQIREMYEPVVRAKNYAMRQMIETGKKMGELRYLMLAVLFIFLFTYHFFFAIFTQLKMREKLARAFSMVMVVVLVFTSVDVTVFAATRNSEEKQETQAAYSIVAIETPAEELSEQTLPVGATENQIRFPETLTVTVVDNTAPVATATPEATQQPTVTEAPATEVPEATGVPETTETPETEAPATETPAASEEPVQSPETTDAPAVTEAPAQEAPAEPESPAAEPDAASESDVAPASENEAEPVEQKTEAEQPAGEVSRAGQILSDTIDALFPAMRAYAAESTVTGETRELPVTWELVAEQSSKDTFAAENAGEYYTYQPVFSEDYTLADGVELPVITVRIQETDVAFEQSATVDGITVTVSAEEGVFPEGATLQVERITAGEQLDTITDEVSQAQAEEIAAKRDEATGGRLYDTEIYAFDITILNAQGEEIQPDTTKGEVKVRFSNLPMENAEGDTQQMFCMDDAQNVELLDTLTDAEEKTTETLAEHFTVYGVALSTQSAVSGNVTLDPDNSKTAESLVGELIAGDEQFAATDAKRNGTVKTFSDGKDLLGIDSGIVLDTSGNVAGTNDAQLDKIRDQAYRYGGHTSSLEFTMEANGDMLCFNYVFASGEFNQNPRYNDVFGLFVKVNDGDWQNIAKITRNNGTEVPVNITNLRAGKSGTEMDNGTSYNLAGSHSLFNTSTASINYNSLNGISNVFTAMLPVTPGDKVTLKFAICDISDTAFNSYVFIEGKSLSFKGPKKTLSYTDADGKQQTIEKDEGEAVTAPEAPSKDGYFFTGWNTQEDGSGETYQPGEEFPLTEDTKLYPMWEQIKNTARVNLRLDDAAWDGQKVELWQSGSAKYTLSEKSEGTYQNTQVVNGSYDVYVNGRKTDKSFTFDAKKSALSATQEVTYRTLRIETILDGSASSIPGAVTLRQNQSVVYTPEGQNGVYEYKVLTSENAYDIFVDGMDTGFDVSNTDPQKTIEYYMAQVEITDDAAWTNAKVELRDAQGKVAAVLAAGTPQGNMVIYKKALQKNEAATLNLYVEDRDVHKILQSAEGKCSTALNYYTATVVVKGEIPSPYITMTNGVENYIFTGNKPEYQVEHVLRHEENDQELKYEVTVANTVDNSKHYIDSANKKLELQYWTVNHYTFQSSSNLEERLVRTVYVLDGSTMPVYIGNVKLNAYTFSHWSETKWIPGDQENAGGTAFDYTQKITKNVNLYANFTIPAVKIGDVVYTDENGNIDGKGSYYQMRNLTISGFEPGDDSIKYIYLTTTNTEKIILLSTDGISQVMNGSSNVNISSIPVSFVPGTDKIAIIFENAVSMAAAQDFLRNQVVIQPKKDTENVMIVEVSDKGGKYVAANAVTATQTMEKGTLLSGTNNGSKTLSESNIYYVMQNTSYTGSSGNSGLIVPSGKTVYIYIASGATLTVTGGNASGRTGAGAGIEVPYNSTLVLLGEGKVIAKGGNAAQGGSGSSGGAGFVSANSYYHGGDGGAGGYGGGGAGSGIGGTGGYGGAGGSTRLSGGNVYNGDKNNYSGSDGYPGGSGGSGASAGTVYVLDKISLTATAGSGATGGTAGSYGGYDTSSTKWNGKTYHTAGGGGGGAGGGGGYPAQAIGGGGAAGGGGGSGGSGGTDYAESKDHNYNQNALCSGAGGNAGRGWYDGASGSGSRDSGEYDGSWKNTGGYGGSGGSAGNNGNNGTSYIAPTARVNGTAGTSSATKTQSYNITFKTRDGKTIQTSNYNFGTQYLLTFPTYTLTNQNEVFLGWQLENYAKSGQSGSIFTVSDGKRYAEGTTETIPASTYGNISFVAVTETVGGVRADDMTHLEIASAGEAITYYTYHVTLKTDNVTVTKGNILIGGKEATPSTDSTYTLISTEKQDELPIVVNGVEVGKTTGFGLLSSMSDTTINYETLQVVVKGKLPQSVTLSGDDAPSLADMGLTDTYLYQTERLAEKEKDSYSVVVDGENTGVTAKWGTPVTVQYYTATVNVQTNGIDSADITSVELRSKNGEIIAMTKKADGQFIDTELSGNTEYTIYVNGEATDQKVVFDKDKTVSVTYSRYTTTVTTMLDDMPVDMGTVTLGTEKMIRTAMGTYQLINNETGTAELQVDGKVVDSSVTKGDTKVINYYTLAYVYAGEQNETGALPEDHTLYLAGTKAQLLANAGLTNGSKTFDGWKIDGKTCKPGDKVEISGKTTAVAVWKSTSIEETTVEVEDTAFIYNGASQTPKVTVTRGNETLTEGKDYKVSYKNSNSGNSQGANNTIIAGTITITLEGIGDYEGQITAATYEIKKKGVVVAGLKAKDRIYDGTKKVTLDDSQVTLEGVVDGDEVNIAASTEGTIETADTGNDRIVTIDEGNLGGAAASNYELRPSEPITVNIQKKSLTEAMFAVPDVTYNGTAQEPVVTAEDKASVDGTEKNLITSADYSVEYQNNIHAGEGTVVITGANNYAGTVTLSFKIAKAPLEITALAASSAFGAEVADVTGRYQITNGKIFTEADKENLEIKATTSVKEGYEAKIYKDAVTISYNKDNTDYEVTTKAADYTVQPSTASISAVAIGYTGVYDGKEHGIRVIPQADTEDATAKIYYSTEELTVENFTSQQTAGKVLDSTPTYKDAGTYTVYYYVDSENYADYAGSAVIRIEKADVTVTAKNASLTYGATLNEINPGVVITGLVDGDTESALTGTVKYLSKDYKQYSNVGTYAILPTGFTAKNYDITYQAGTLKVEPKPVTVKWQDNTAFTYTGSKQGITATLEGLVNGDLVEPVYAGNTAVNAGSYMANVTGLSGNNAANYQLAEDAVRTKEWSINKADNEWMIMPSIQGWTAGSDPNAPVAAAKYGTVEEIQYTYAKKPSGEDTADYSDAVPTTAGEYLMLAKVPGTENYNELILTVPVAFIITAQTGGSEKKIIYVNPANAEITYGEDIPDSVSVTYTDAAGEGIEGEILQQLSGNLSYSTTYKKGDAVRGNVGEYLLTVSGQTAPEGYELVFRTSTLTVKQKEVSLSWPVDRKLPYTGFEQSVTAKVEGLVDGDVVSVGSYTGNTATAAGTYQAEATTLTGTNADNYKLPEDAGCAWEIVKAANAFTINPTINDWYYGEEPSTPVAAAKYGEVQFRYEKVETNVFARLLSLFTGNSETVPTEAGNYKLIATVEAGDGYDKLEETISFQIRPAQVVVNVQDVVSSYGKEIQTPSQYTLTILKGKISGEEQAALQIQLQTEATQKSAVGTYSITAKTQTSSNIAVEVIPGVYTIQPVTLTGNTSPVNVVYDGEAHGMDKPQITTADGADVKGLEIYYSTKELNSQNYGSGSKTSPTITDAGTMTVYYYAAAENYAPVTGSAVVKVEPRQVTVTANNAAIIYGEAAVNAGVKYDGFAGKDSEESLGLNPSYNYRSTDGTEYQQGSPAGSYRIIPGGLSAPNYTFAYTEGTLAIAKKQLTEEMFTLAAENLTYDKTAKTPDVTGQDGELLKSSDYTVTYAENVNAGDHTASAIITATEAGNYQGSVTLKFNIASKSITVKANPAESEYNAAVADVSYTIAPDAICAGDEADLNLQAVTSVKKGYQAGTYTGAVTVSYNEKNKNYQVTVESADYVVKEAQLEVTADPYQGIYDGKEHTAEITAKTHKFLTYAKIYYSAEHSLDALNYENAETKKPAFTEAGTHTIYYYAVCDNYEAVSGSVNVVITKAPLTVTVPDGELTYGEAPDNLLKQLADQQATENQLKATGYAGSDNWEKVFGNSQITFTTDYSQNENAGNWKLSVNGLTAANYEVKVTAGTLTVDPKPITFTWTGETGFTYDGNSHSVEAEVSGKVKDTDDVRPGNYTGNSATAAGEYTATVTGLTGAAAGNYTFAENEVTAKQAWKIGRAENAFTITPAISNWTEGNTAGSPYAAAKYGEVTFAYSDKEDGTYQSADIETLQDLKVGTYYLKATVAGNDNYTGLEEIITFTVNAKAEDPAQTVKSIVIRACDKQSVYGDAFETVSLNAADVEITGLEDGQNLTDVADGNLTFTTDYKQGSPTGTYLLIPGGLTAKTGFEIIWQAGDLTVSRKPVSLTWGTDSFVYDGQEHTISAAVNEGLSAGDSIVVTGYEYNESNKIRNTAVNAGTYTAHATGFSGVNWQNYQIAAESASHTWTITKAPAGTTDPDGTGNSFIVGPTIHGWTYGETPNAPYAEATFGTPRFEYANAADGIYTAQVPQTAGTWYLRAVVDGTENYETITSTPFMFKIKKAKVIITADDIASAYGEKLATLTYQVSGKIKEGDDLGITLSTTASESAKAGEYPINVAYTENANYEVTVRKGTYFITASATKLQVTASGYTGEYDGAAHGITVEVKDADGKAAKDVTVYYSETELTESNYGTGSTTVPTMTDAGTKKVYYYVASEDALPITGSQDIEITKKKVTVKAENAGITYGDAPMNNGVTYSGFVGSDTAESLGVVLNCQYNYEQYQDAGSYRITPVVTDTRNYHFVVQAGVLTVSRKPVTFTWPTDQFVYDGTAKVMKAETNGIVNNDAVGIGTYEEDLTQKIQSHAVETGIYTAKVSTLTGAKAGNYVIENGEATATRAYRILSGTNYFTVVPSIESWTYGETSAEPVAQSAYGTPEFVYSNSMYGTYTEEKPTQAGNYFMKARVEATENYGALESTAVPFSIRKAKITVTANDRYAKPGDALQELTYDITGNTIEGEELEIGLTTTAAEHLSTEGSYPINVEVVKASANYEVTTVEGTYYILDKSYTINAQGVNTVYDGQEHGITVTVEDADGNLPEGVQIYYSEQNLAGDTDFADSTEVTTVSPTRKDAGSLTVYYYIVDQGSVISGSKTVTIVKKALRVIAGNAEINKGDEPKNAGVTYDGFVEGEDESYLSGSVSYQYSYIKGQPDGAYSITPRGLRSNNYELQYIPGTLTVHPVAIQTEITGVQADNAIYDGEIHPGYVGVPTAGDGQVTEFVYEYRTADGTVLNGAPKDAGTYMVTIKIPDDNVYYKGSVEIPFTIAKRTIRILPKNQAMLAGQDFIAAEPEYEGFVGDDNKDGKAIETPAVIAPEAGADLTTAGKVTIKVTDAGSLTAEAAKNYELDATETANLTIIAMPAEPGKDESGSSVKLDEDPNSGIVKIAVIKEEEHLPETEIEADFTIEVAEALLDDSEIQRVKDGENALVYLLLSEAEQTTSAEEKQKITDLAASIAKDVNIGLYLDLSLYKKVGNSTPSKITQTGEQTVTIEITLPESLKVKTANVERTYYIIYVHDGEAKQITPQYKDGVLTFEASEFSVYTIAYKDTTVAPTPTPTPTPGDVTPTPTPGDATPTPGGNVTPAPTPGDTTPTPGGNVTPTPAPGNATPAPGGDSSDDGGNDTPEATQVPAVTQAPGTTAAPASGSNKPQGGKKPGATGSGNTTGQTEQPAASAQPETTAQPEASTQPGTTEQPGAVTQPETVTAGVKEKDQLSISTETKKRLEEALEKVTKADSGIQAGPYVQPESSVSGGSTDGNAETGTTAILVEIPEDLRAEGRTFYLMMTDADGNIIILPNESLEDGVISVTGSADAVYQIIYEDGGSTLADMLTGDGKLTDGNGKPLTVSTNHCLWHWLILVITLLGLGAIALLGRKKKKYIWFFGAVTTVPDLIVAIIGYCVLDWIFLIAGLLLMACLAVFLYRGSDDDSHYAAQA